MIRSALPASLMLFIGVPLCAEDALTDAQACTITGDQNSCVRVLACVGEDGLWIDGEARGWGDGTMSGLRSDGTVCGGFWSSNDGPGGAGTARFECSDGSKARVIYFSQDPATGTVLGRGMDDQGRIIAAWSGKYVLKFLGETDVDPARLPCAAEPILLG